ncbi:TNF receptor-associated factor 5 [Parasteatoda tepidariorum]|uniref:TNF receptor-associated factor 5 n=1 Tax=Parasteatoda tepidariorum TaxID=114398 RepID=UPI000A2BFD65|nr:TNF receptor-associated factor 5 [Parasteatoda tepidariorum]
MADETVQLENVEFVQSCPMQYRCRRCSSLDSALNRARCGHGFCGRCVNMVRAARFQCPVDSRSVEKKELVVDREIKDKILELSVYCLQKKRGCKRTLILKELEHHLETCGYVPVSCPCSCGLQVTKRDLAQHLTSNCERRLVPCSYCQEDVVFKDMDQHNDICGKKPVICPHCKAEVRREQLLPHELMCPMKPRCCPLAEAGCPFKGTSEELDTHSNDVQTHMRIMAEAMTQYRLNIQNLEEKVAESVSENIKLKEQLQDIYPVLGTVKNLDKTVTSLQEKIKKLEIAEQTIEEMNETLVRLKEYMQRAQPAVVQDHKSKSPPCIKSPQSKSPPHGVFNHNVSFEDQRPKHAAPPTDL